MHTSNFPRTFVFFAATFVLSIIVLTGLLPAQTPVSFSQARRDYHGSGNALAIGDFNRDGNLDIAEGGTGVNLFFGGPDGGFRPAVTVHGVADVQGIVAVDVNHDGILDLIVTERNRGDIAVLLGKGDGSFQAPLRVTGLPSAFSLVAADFNNDGNIDVAVGQNASSSVFFLLGSGDGHFTLKSTNTVASYATSLVAADFNHDGNIDVAAATQQVLNATPGVNVLFGKGDGTFGPYQPVNAGGGQYYLVTADLNRDGNPDLICTAGGSTPPNITVLLGNPDGTFQPPAQVFPGSTTTVGPLTAADINGDGIPDIMGEDYNGLFVVALGKGDGTFQAGQNFSCGTFAYAILAADFNHDGKNDVAVLGGSTAAVSVLFGDGQGRFTQPPHYAAGISPGSIQLVDVNGDGVLDAVTAGFSQKIPAFSVLLGNGTGGFGAPITFTEPGKGIASYALADLNHDGKPDLLVISSSNFQQSNLTTHLGNGDGTFKPGSGIPFPNGSLNASFAIGDFNRDGNPDVAVATDPTFGMAGVILLFLGNGDGTFQAARSFAVGSNVGSGVDAVATGDFNHDGFLDVAVTTRTGVAVLPGDGAGNLLSPVSTTLTQSSLGLAVAELNGDQFPDLVVSVGSINPGAIDEQQVLFGNGDGTFQIGPTPSSFDIVYQLQVADVNGDSIPDIIVQNYYYGDIAVLLGNAQGGYAYPYFFGGGWGESGVAVGDLNGDGKPDLVTANFYGASVSVLINNTK